ncbi:MAG: hypothetical protein LBK54_10285 [Propionibacteriaceae bacterium]|jgi:hypothetical protein|nr:hypothetical protein [Propionibacteriaceae bacterium]
MWAPSSGWWPEGGSVVPESQVVVQRGGQSWDLSEAVTGLSWSASTNGRIVSGQLDMTVADPDGSLRQSGGPLWTAGQTVWARVRFDGSAWCPLPPARLSDAGGDQVRWVTRRRVPMGQHDAADVTGDDLTALIERGSWSGLLGPAGLSMVDETVRLLAAAGVGLPVAMAWWDPSMQSRLVRATATYDTNPLSALSDLWALMGAAVWVNRDGQVEPRPLDPVTDPWPIRVDEIFELALDGSAEPRNRVVVTGSDEANNPIQGMAEVKTGLWAVDGPFGVNTRREQMSIGKDVATLTRAAETYLWQEIGSMTRTLTASVHPAVGLRLDVLDPVVITDPDRKRWAGQVIGLDHQLGGPSTATIRVPEEAR